MPASPNPETGLQSIITTFKTMFRVVVEEGQSNFNLLFRKVKIRNFEYDIPIVKLFNLSVEIDKLDNICSMKPIYVLIKTLNPSEDEMEVNVNDYKFEKPEIKVSNYKLKDITSKICSYNYQSMPINMQNYSKLRSVATICNAKDLKLPEAKIGSLQIVPINKPKTDQVSVKLSTKILKRSEVFASNLPIEKKPVSMLLYTKNDLDFFKQKLAEKMNTNKRLIKLSFIYDKLNYKNLQNVKFDAQTQRVFCNFKPKNQLVDSPENAFLIIGSRVDNNASGSMMVTNSEFEKYRNK